MPQSAAIRKTARLAGFKTQICVLLTLNGLRRPNRLSSRQFGNFIRLSEPGEFSAFRA